MLVKAWQACNRGLSHGRTAKPWKGLESMQQETVTDELRAWCDCGQSACLAAFVGQAPLPESDSRQHEHSRLLGDTCHVVSSEFSLWFNARVLHIAACRSTD